MAAIVHLIRDIGSHPFCSSVIFTSIWIWIKFLFEEWDQRYHLLSYQDGVLKRQYWKFFPVSVTNTSYLTVLINVMCWWNLRVIEGDQGTGFVFKNTLLICILNLAFSVITMSYALQHLPQVYHHALSLTCIHSSSSVIIGWTTFQAISYMGDPSSYPAWGTFLSLPISTIPLLMLTFYYLFSTKQYLFANFTGLLSGCCLGFGLYVLIASSYWAWCFLIDCLLLVAFSLKVGDASTLEVDQLFRSYSSQRNRRVGDAEEVEFIVECIEHPEFTDLPISLPPHGRNSASTEVEMTSLRPQSVSASASSSSLLNNFGIPNLVGSRNGGAGNAVSAGIVSNGIQSDGNNEEYDEEALQPLLSSSNDVSKAGQTGNGMSHLIHDPRRLWRNLTQPSTMARQKDGYSELTTEDEDLEGDNRSNTTSLDEKRKVSSSSSSRLRDTIPDR